MPLLAFVPSCVSFVASACAHFSFFHSLTFPSIHLFRGILFCPDLSLSHFHLHAIHSPFLTRPSIYFSFGKMETLKSRLSPFQDPSSYPFVYNPAAATFCHGDGGGLGPSTPLTPSVAPAAFSYNMLTPPPLTPGAAAAFGGGGRRGSGGGSRSSGGLWFPPTTAAPPSSPWSRSFSSSSLNSDGGGVFVPQQPPPPPQQDVYSFPGTAFIPGDEHVSKLLFISSSRHCDIISFTAYHLPRFLYPPLFGGIK